MRVGTLYAILRLETGAFDAALIKSQGKMMAFFGLIRAGAVIATSALALIVGGAIAAGASFEHHMTQATAIMVGVTDSVRKQLEEVALDVSTSTIFSASQAADAYYYLASAGYDAAQSMRLLPVVANFAQAAQLDLAKATEYLAAVQTTLGLSTDDFGQNTINMVRVSNVLTQAANESLATMEQLAAALTNKAGPAMRAVNMEIEDGVAILAVLGDQGIFASRAGTGLSIILRDLQTKTLKNSEAFADFGIHVYDSAGNLNDMADIIGEMENAFKGMSHEQIRATLLQLGFQDRSIPFIQALLGESDAIRQYEKDLRAAGDATDIVAAKQLQALIPQLIILWHWITKVGILLFRELEPALLKVVFALQDWFRNNEDLIVQIQHNVLVALHDLATFIATNIWPWVVKMADAVARVAAGLARWYAENKKIIDQIAEFALDTFVEGLKTLADTIIYIADNYGPFLAVVVALRLLFAVLAASPVTRILLGIIIAVGLFSKAWDSNWNGIRDTLMQVWDSVEPVVSGIVYWVGAIIRNIDKLDGFIGDDTPIGHFAEIFVPIADGFRSVVGFIGDLITNLGNLEDYVDEDSPMGAFARIVLGIGDAWTYLVENVFPKVWEFITAIGGWIIDHWPTISELIGHFVDVLGGILGVVITIGEIAWPILVRVAEDILPAIGVAADVLLTTINTVFTSIGNIWQAAADVAEWLGLKVEDWGPIIEAVTPIIDGLVLLVGTTLVLAFGAWIVSMATAAVTASITLVTAIANLVLAIGAGTVAGGTGLIGALAGIALIIGPVGVIVLAGIALWTTNMGGFRDQILRTIDAMTDLSRMWEFNGLNPLEPGAWFGGTEGDNGFLGLFPQSAPYVAPVPDSVNLFPTPPSSDPYNFQYKTSGFLNTNMFASGVRGFGGGLAMVGEQGPELLNLPPGSDVFSNGETRHILGGMNGIRVAIDKIEINGVGNDVSQGAARRFAQAVLDEVAVGIQEQGSRFANAPGVVQR